MPTSGEAVYEVDTLGRAAIDGALLSLSGAGSFTADFAAGTLMGGFDELFAEGRAEAPGGFTSEAAIAEADNLFSGTTTGTGGLAGTSGSLEGVFYGPGAAEIGGVWTLSDGTASPNSGVNAMGGFVGKTGGGQ